MNLKLASTRFTVINGGALAPHRRLDILIGAFEMCHRLELDGRLELEDPTITVADLPPTKPQIVELNEKDAPDALSLIGEHEIGRGLGDIVDLTYLESPITNDRRLSRTITATLNHLREISSADRVGTRIHEMRETMSDPLKRLPFKLRSRVGDCVPWYRLPDEVRT